MKPGSDKSPERRNPGAVVFDLRSLEVFLAVVETRSMTAAAGRLGMTQPAVSQTIRQLEKRVGVPLIVRNPRPFVLTMAGTVLQDRAITLLESARHIIPAVREAGSARMPLVRVGIIDSLFPLIAPALGVELRSSVDQLSLWSGLTSAHLTSFLERSLDLVMAQDPLEDVNELERHVILREPYILLLPAKYRKKLPDTLNDLVELSAQLPLIRYTARSYSGRDVERYLRRHRLNIPRKQELDTTEGVLTMVASGFGWTITTPMCALEARAGDRNIVCTRLPGQPPYRQIVLVARTGELGRIPRKVKDVTEQTLTSQVLPQLRKLMPWLGDEFSV